MTIDPKTSTVASGGETDPAADRVMITYYTDPLCCWSYGLEPHWQRLRREFSAEVEWRYVMGGMIENWNSYSDPMNAVSRPVQFGPVWMHAGQVCGMPIDYTLWHTDPPASSFPSCIAVKCAQFQSREAGELLLIALRSAVMTAGRNIARESVILSVAREVSETDPERFNIEEFEGRWRGGSGVEAFRTDLQQTRFLRIGRYPTLTFMRANGHGVMVTGYRPYEILKEALGKVLSGLK